METALSVVQLIADACAQVEDTNNRTLAMLQHLQDVIQLLTPLKDQAINAPWIEPFMNRALVFLGMLSFYQTKGKVRQLFGVGEMKTMIKDFDEDLRHFLDKVNLLRGIHTGTQRDSAHSNRSSNQSPEHEELDDAHVLPWLVERAKEQHPEYNDIAARGLRLLQSPTFLAAQLVSLQRGRNSHDLEACLHRVEEERDIPTVIRETLKNNSPTLRLSWSDMNIHAPALASALQIEPSLRHRIVGTVAIQNVKSGLLVQQNVARPHVPIQAQDNDFTRRCNQWYRIQVDNEWAAFKNVHTNKVLESIESMRVVARSTDTTRPGCHWHVIQVDGVVALKNRRANGILDHYYEASVSVEDRTERYDYGERQWRLIPIE